MIGQMLVGMMGLTASVISAVASAKQRSHSDMTKQMVKHLNPEAREVLEGAAKEKVVLVLHMTQSDLDRFVSAGALGALQEMQLAQDLRK